MLDFNSHGPGHTPLVTLIDAALSQAHARSIPRAYLGASRLGVTCERALQFEVAQAPVDAGREFTARLLRIFERGHLVEDCVAGWLRQAGFDLRTSDEAGQQFGFAALDGRLQGHMDGVILAGPADYSYPCLWETKCLNHRAFAELQKRGVALAKPVYAGQVALYQAYFQLHAHPALFTAVNADTMEIYAEWVPFDGALAQRLSDRAVRIVLATEAGELLPRHATTPTHHECRQCAWQDRCWRDAR